MKLHLIANQTPPLLMAALRLYGMSDILLYEAKWPQDWSDRLIHDPKVINWLNSVGVSGDVGSPMEGGVGGAYPVGENFIVKFTTDDGEASAAAIIQGHDSPNAATIYGVKRVKSYVDPVWKKQKSLYIIAMEKLNRGVGKRYRIAANAAYEYLDKNPGFINDVDQVVNDVINNNLNDKQRKDESIRKAVYKVIHGLYDIQKRTGVLSQDPHGGNIAFKDREPGFFDFGRSEIDYEHPKAAGVKISKLDTE